MATTYTTPVEETRIVHEDDSSAGMIAVLIVAAVLIIGLLLFAMNAFPFAATDTGTDIDVDLPNITTPDTTPNVNMEQNNTTPTAPGADVNTY